MTGVFWTELIELLKLKTENFFRQDDRIGAKRRKTANGSPKGEHSESIFRRDRSGEQVLWADRRASAAGQFAKLIRKSLFGFIQEIGTVAWFFILGTL
jgi:hypothetical protein